MEKRDLTSLPTSSSANRMLSYVSSEFYHHSYVGKWIYQVMGMEYDKAQEIVNSLPYQFFPETASWGLMYHEMKWKLPIQNDLSYEERRKLIYQKRDFRAPMTPYRMEEYLKNVTNFEVKIFDIQDKGKYYFSHPNIFWVQLIGEGTANISGIRQALNKMKQSHTSYFLSDYIAKKIDVKVLMNTHMIIKNEFFPKVNIPYLKYDGTAQYNRTIRYNKYKTGERIQLYPIQLGIRSEIQNRIFYYPPMILKNFFMVPTHFENKIGYRKERKIQTKIESKLRITKENTIIPNYQIRLKIGKHPNRYDGKCRYDGKSRYYVEKEELL